MTLSKPEIATVGDSMLFTWPEGVEIALDRFFESRGDVSAEAVIQSSIAPNAGLLHAARVNLMSSPTRAALVKTLSSRVRDLDWHGLLEQLCFLAVQRYRDGDPSIDLRDVDPYAQTRWLLYPYIEHGGPTVLFAEGDSGKSVLALWMALQVALGADGKPSHPVLYLDYETSKEIHAERMNALCVGLGVELDARPPVFYRRATASLPQGAAAIRKEIDRLRIGLLVIDSLGGAGDGPPEEAATAIRLFQAVRTFPVPSLCIHHKRKPTGFKGESQRDRAFGSVYYVNFARLAWEVEAVKDEQQDDMTVGLVNCKANNGRLLKRHALRLRFTNEGDRLTRVDVEKRELADTPELAHRVPLKERILQALTSGPQASQGLATELDEKLETVQVRCSELKAGGKILKIPDGRWGLRSRDAVS